MDETWLVAAPEQHGANLLHSDPAGHERTRTVGIALALCPAARAESGIATALPDALGRTKGLNLMVSVLAAPGGEWKPSGFLLGFGVEGSGFGRADLNVGMSYLRLDGSARA